MVINIKYLCKNYLVNSVPKRKKTYFVRQTLSCTSNNVVSLVHCKKCNLQYVGLATPELKVCFRNHKSLMKTNRKTCEVAIHFKKTLHILSDFIFQSIDQIENNTNQDVEKLLITKGGLLECTIFFLMDWIRGRNSIQRIAYITHKLSSFNTRLHIS